MFGWTKNCELSLVTFVQSFLNLLWVTATQRMFTIPSILYQFENASKQSTFNKHIMSGKDFKATSSLDYPVDDTKDFEGLFKIQKNVQSLKTI